MYCGVATSASTNFYWGDAVDEICMAILSLPAADLRDFVYYLLHLAIVASMAKHCPAELRNVGEVCMPQVLFTYRRVKISKLLKSLCQADRPDKGARARPSARRLVT